MSAAPADVATIAEATYHELGPILGVHSPCRVFMAIAAGVARASGVPYEAVFDRDYEEDGQRTAHYWLELGGQRLDLWDRQVRLRPPAAAVAPVAKRRFKVAGRQH